MIKRKNCSLYLVRESYRGINGHHISKAGKAEIGETHKKSLTYGEIVPQSFCQILDTIARIDGGLGDSKCFVDLGCGVGRAVLCAALANSAFSQCWGIELLPGLIEAAQKAKCNLEELLNSSFEDPPVPASVNTAVLGVSKGNAPNDLVRKLVDLIQQAPEQKMMSEALANKVCLELGHKAFKNTLKLFQVKKFTALLKLFPEIFEVTEFLGDNIVSLVDSDQVVSDDSLLTLTEEAIDSSLAMEAHAADHEEVALHNTKKDLEIRKDLRLYANEIFSPMANILFECNDIFILDWWTTADVVYCASLLFSDEMMTKLSILVCRMKVGSWFISLKQLDDIVIESNSELREEIAGNRRKYCLKHDSFFKMSWQMAKVYIYKVEEL